MLIYDNPLTTLTHPPPHLPVEDSTKISLESDFLHLIDSTEDANTRNYRDMF